MLQRHSVGDQIGILALFLLVAGLLLGGPSQATAPVDDVSSSACSRSMGTIDFDADSMLFRALRQDGEGQAFRVDRDAYLTRADAIIWDVDARRGVELTINTTTGGSSLLARRVVERDVLPKHADAGYRIISFRFHPPVALRANDRIEAIFRTPVGTAVSGIRLDDPDPESNFVSLVAWGGSRTEHWDYLVRLCLE